MVFKGRGMGMGGMRSTKDIDIKVVKSWDGGGVESKGKLEEVNGGKGAYVISSTIKIFKR